MKTVEEFMSLTEEQKLIIIKQLVGYGWSDDIGDDMQLLIDELKGKP